MTLSVEDGKLYYKLWLPLLDFVNEKYGVNKELGQIAGAEGLDANKVKEVADKLWDDVSVIDEYLAGPGQDLPKEHKDIIEGFKRRIRGRFILERHLKKGSIFISGEDEQVYQVLGIVSSWEEMFYYRRPPILMEATLMPFRDAIISDGLVLPYNIVIGGNMARSFKEIYMAAKKGGRLRKTL